jgi:hypothetical protein
MRSVADLLKVEDRRTLAALTPADADRLLLRRRQQGRRPSRCLQELIG